MTTRDVPMRMTLSRETESRETESLETESRESALSIEVRPSGSNAAIRISVPPLDDERAAGDDERSGFARHDDEPTAITSTIGTRLTPLPARVQTRHERPSRMTMSPVAPPSRTDSAKKGGA